jgi:HEAT repeat protein
LSFTGTDIPIPTPFKFNSTIETASRMDATAFIREVQAIAARQHEVKELIDKISLWQANTDGGYYDRSQTLRMLENLGPRAAPAAALLIQLTGSEDALTAIGTRAIPALADAMRLESPHVRARALRLLRKVSHGDEHTVRLFVKALDDEHTQVRSEAVLGLRDFGPRASDGVRTVVPFLSDSNLAFAARDYLTAIGAPAVPPLLTVLATSDDTARTNALLALKHMGPGAVLALPALRQLIAAGSLSSKLSTLAREAIEWIDLKDSYVADFIGRALREPVIFPTASTFVVTCQEAALPHLLKAARYGVVRKVLNLGSVWRKHRTVHRRGRQVLPVPGPRARRKRAVQLLAISICKRGLSPNAGSSFDEIVDVLVGCLKEVVLDSYAASALGALRSDTAARAVVHVLGMTNSLAVRSLIECGSAAIPVLTEQLQAEEGWSNAAWVLKHIGDEAAVGALVAHLAGPWRRLPSIASSLAATGWYPESTRDAVHFLVARAVGVTPLSSSWHKLPGTLLKTHPQLVDSVLIADLTSGTAQERDTALRAYVALGRSDVVPHLISILNTRGDVQLAESFLNCHYPPLAQAARAWAHMHGYAISTRTGAADMGWGAW